MDLNSLFCDSGIFGGISEVYVLRISYFFSYQRLYSSDMFSFSARRSTMESIISFTFLLRYPYTFFPLMRESFSESRMSFCSISELPYVLSEVLRRISSRSVFQSFFDRLRYSVCSSKMNCNSSLKIALPSADRIFLTPCFVRNPTLGLSQYANK